MEDLKFILDIGKAGANIVLPESLEFSERETTLPNEVSRLSNPNLIGNVSPVNFCSSTGTEHRNSEHGHINKRSTTI